MSHPFRILIMLFAMLAPMAASAAAEGKIRHIRGIVIDSITSEPVPMVAVSIESSKKAAAIGKADGRFELTTRKKFKYLTIRASGFRPAVVYSPQLLSSDSISIRMQPAMSDLAEVIVRPGRTKYSRRNNPAVDLMERIRRDSRLTDPYTNDFYSNRRYQRLSISLTDIKLDSAERLPKKFRFMSDYIQDNPLTGQPMLLVSMKEQTSRELFRRNPRSQKTVIEGSRSDGVDQGFNQENVQTFLRDVLREVEIYDNDIILLQNRFVSPLSRIAANYYKFAIADTTELDGQRCIELLFVPHNPESFGFNGRMYIPLDDSARYVKRIEMRVPASINLNYVSALAIQQDFALDSIGKRHKVRDRMDVAFKILPRTPGLHASRESYFDRFSYLPDSTLARIYSLEGRTHTLRGAASRDSVFWSDARTIAPTKAQSNMGHMLSQLRTQPLFATGEKILEVIVKGYFSPTRSNKVDIGPVNTMISGNTVEGVRLRLGAMTTANLNPHIFARVYEAYGTRDHRWKYGTELEYSFIPKKYHSREFPINSLRLNHSYDLDMLGQHYLFTNPDNAFLSFKRMPSDKVTYRRLTTLYYTMERLSGFSIEAGVRHEIQYPTKWLPFRTGMDTYSRHFTLAALHVQLRYAPGETFYQAASMRIPINLDAPVLMLTHEYGPRGFLGANFTLNKTEFSAQKRLWLSAFGYIDGIIKVGKIWSRVPYVALTWPNANLSYTIQPESFALMNPMEFATDSYLSWDATYWLNGALFNSIPLLKKLKLREVLTFRGFWGRLSDKNNPSFDPELYVFPPDADVRLMGRKPYMEIGVGIENILTFLRLDYIWRLTYRDTPGADRRGLRLALHFTF